MITLAWNVLYTKSKTEKKVFERLSDLGIDVYCPCQRTLKKWSDRKKWVNEPVFKSYIFVKAPDSESQKLQILNTPGVVRFLYWLGQPAQVRQVEIDAIRSFLGEHQSVESVSFDVGASLTDEGFCEHRVQGRFHRARMTITGNWSFAQGLDMEGRPIGRR